MNSQPYYSSGNNSFTRIQKRFDVSETTSLEQLNISSSEEDVFLLIGSDYVCFITSLVFFLLLLPLVLPGSMEESVACLPDHGIIRSFQNNHQHCSSSIVQDPETVGLSLCAVLCCPHSQKAMPKHKRWPQRLRRFCPSRNSSKQ